MKQKTGKSQNSSQIRPEESYLSIAAGGSLGGRSVRHAVPAGRVEAEQLGADAFVLEAGGRPPVPPALGVQREERPGQGPAQGFVLVRRVVQATGGVTTGKGRMKASSVDSSNRTLVLCGLQILSERQKNIMNNNYQPNTHLRK